MLISRLLLAISTTAATLAAPAEAAFNPQAPFRNANDPPRVPVHLGVMSRCPDARTCEAVIGEVLKHNNIVDKIDLTLGFIGTVDADTPYGVACMHGDIECAGNAHELCIHENLDLKTFYSILLCLNYGKFPGAIGTIAQSRQCVEANGIDWWKSGVGKCIEGRHVEAAVKRNASEDIHEPALEFRTEDEAWAYEFPIEHLGLRARRLLLDSVKDTVKRGIKKSCTIEITSTLGRNGKDKRVCVVDDGVWKGCDDGHQVSDFVKVIEEEYRNLKR